MAPAVARARPCSSAARSAPPSAAWLGISERERRILLVAGVAAGLAAVFRTPLGAALFAAEVLYRDDFESDALIPGVLASVIAYSVVISIFGENRRCSRTRRATRSCPRTCRSTARWPWSSRSSPCSSSSVLRFVQRTTKKLPVPAWARPAVGGLVLGIL